MSTLSRILLNPQKRGARKLLTNPQAMHAAVRAAFPPDINESDARVLWRADSGGPTTTLYIVGPEPPELDHIVEQAGWATRPGDTADYAPFLDSLKRGQQWSFRLVGNPVKSLSREGPQRGKVVPHVTASQQTEWLLSRAAAAGFEVVDVPGSGPDVIVTKRSDLSFRRRKPGEGPKSQANGGSVFVRTARFDGRLEVTDVDALRCTLTQGIGRARAYGCGLLSLAKAGAPR